MRLMLFETLFYKADANCDNALSVREAVSALSFLNPTMPKEEAVHEVFKADIDHDGSLQAWEWIIMCSMLLGDTPTDQIQLAMDNYAHAQHNDSLHPKWRHIGKRIDMNARFWVMFLYFTCLGLLFSTSFHDPYGTDSSTRDTSNSGKTYGEPYSMFNGVWATSMSGSDLLVALVMPTILLFLIVGWIWAHALVNRRMAEGQRKHDQLRRGILDRRRSSDPLSSIDQSSLMNVRKARRMNTMPASASDAMLAEEKSVIASAMRKRFDAGVE